MQKILLFAIFLFLFLTIPTTVESCSIYISNKLEIYGVDQQKAKEICSSKDTNCDLANDIFPSDERDTPLLKLNKDHLVLDLKERNLEPFPFTEIVERINSLELYEKEISEEILREFYFSTNAIYKISPNKTTFETKDFDRYCLNKSVNEVSNWYLLEYEASEDCEYVEDTGFCAYGGKYFKKDIFFPINKTFYQLGLDSFIYKSLAIIIPTSVLFIGIGIYI